jgi:hypothetical protein
MQLAVGATGLAEPQLPRYFAPHKSRTQPNRTTKGFNMQFSRRQVVSEQLARQTRSALGADAIPTRIGSVALNTTVDSAEKPLLLSMVIGVDKAPRSMSRTEVEALGDAFTKSLLLRGVSPSTVRELATGIDTLPEELALPNRELFAVAEGAHFKPSHPSIATNTRLAFAWRATPTGAIDLLLSTEPAPDEPDALLERLKNSDTMDWWLKDKSDRVSL